MKSVAKTLFKLLLVLAICWGALTLFAVQREHAAVRAYPPEGQFIEVDDLKLHAVVMGQGANLVLLHGASGHTRDLTFLLAPELAKDYRVIVFDRPGLGYSMSLSPDGGSLREQAEILQKAAAQLGAERPIVLGHSYGAAVGLAWAVHQPDHIAGLITVAGVSHPWKPPLPRRYRILAHPILGPLIIPLYRMMFTEARLNRILTFLYKPEDVPNGYRDHIGPPLSLRRSALIANARQRANLKDELRALAPHYPDIDLPMTIIHGSHDPIVPLESQATKLAREVPEAELIVLDGAGHMPHQSNPGTVIDAIDDLTQRARLHHTD